MSDKERLNSCLILLKVKHYQDCHPMVGLKFMGIEMGKSVENCDICNSMAPDDWNEWLMPEQMDRKEK